MVALTISILYHFSLSIPLVALVWAIGWIWLCAFCKKQEVPGPEEVLYAYPLGLLYVSLASAMILLDARLTWVGISALLLPGLVAVLRHIPIPKNEIKMALGPLATALPFVLVFALTLGVAWHGPTADLAGSPMGDLVGYVAKLYSLKVSLVPHPDLLVEGVGQGDYTRIVPSLIGAVLAHLPGFDAFLFYAVTCSAFFLLSVGLAIRFWCQGNVLSGTEHGVVSALWLIVVFPLLLLSSVAYPSWIVESPPVAFAVPLGFGVFALAHDRRISTVRFMVLTAAFVVCTFLTKVFLLIPFVALLGLSLLAERWDDFGTRPKLSLVALIGILIVAGYVAYMAISYRWIYGLFPLRFSPVTVWLDNNRSLAGVLAVAGQLLLVAGAMQISPMFPMGLALISSILASWTLSASTDIIVGVLVVFTALMVLRSPSVLRRGRLMITMAGVLLALSTWAREVHGDRITFVLFSTMAMSIVILLPDVAIRSSLKLKNIVSYLTRFLSGMGASGLAVILVGVLGGQIGASHGRTGIFTPDDYDIWHKVKTLTPPDALIFSDFTGVNIDMRHGWFSYSGISGRQMYLGGWYAGPLHAEDPATIAERLKCLRQNELVLSGVSAPQSLTLSRHYSSYFAVVEKERDMPETFRLLYSNSSWALYEIPG